MKNIYLTLRRNILTMAPRWFYCLTTAFLAVGCHLPPLPNAVQDLGPRYHPTNIYRRTNALPSEIRRVALLPLVTTDSSGFLRTGVETLSPLVYSELEKSKRFEVIPVASEQLKQWTGQAGWRTDEPLPPDFFARVADATGCDAILFCQLTRFEPYQPVAVGWKFSLVANPPPGPINAREMKDRILWSADEVMDVGDTSVANSARDYYESHMHSEAASADATTILSSPARFGQYTLAALFDTLPQRPGWIPSKTR